MAVAVAIWQVDLLMAVVRGGRDAPSLETATAKSGEFIVGFNREGEIRSADVESVRAPRSGSTITWIADDGAKVKKGDLIAKVDVGDFLTWVETQRLARQNAQQQVGQQKRDRTREYESAQMNAEKTLRSLDVLVRSQVTESGQAQAQVGFDQWNLAWATTDYDKQSRLSQAGIVPRSAAEQSERSLRSSEYGLARSQKAETYLGAEHASKKKQSESDIGTARFEAELAQRRIGESVQGARKRAELLSRQVEDMESQLSGGELRSPKGGVVILGETWDQNGRRALREGDQIYGDMKVADVTNLSALEIKVRVDESSIQQLKPGQEAVVTTKAAPGRQFEGRIIAVGQVAREVRAWEDPNAVPGVRVFDVTVKVLRPDIAVLRPGVKTEVQFVEKRIAQTTYVPVDAVFDRPEGQVVYVRQDERFVPRKIETGERNDKSVIVLKGVKPGENVAMNDPTRVGAD